MKLLSRLVIALAVCLMLLPAVASPVQAAGHAWKIDNNTSYSELDDDEGYVGDEAKISGWWDEAHDDDVYVFFELFNVSESKWDSEKEGDQDYDEIDEEYYFRLDDFEIPESCFGKHEVYICDEDDPDDDVVTLDFTVHPFIEIDDDDGPAGTKVGVSGKGWDDDDETTIDILFFLEDPVDDDDYDDDDFYVVAWSGTAELNDRGSWENVTFEVPHASQGKHWVYAVSDEANDIVDDAILGVEFEVTPGISVDPAEGSLGDEITVTGSGFEEDEEDIEILFDGDTVAEDIEADENGMWEATFEVPEAAKGTHDIGAKGKKTKKSDVTEVDFEVMPGLALSPTSGHVGTSLTVSGSGFPASQSVTVTYDGTSVGSATTTSDGNLTGITFAATHTQTTHTVDHPVVVTYDNTTTTLNFVMESDAPPKPALVLPLDDSRIGYVGRVTPTFQWKVVDDPSGVTYDLQIATSLDFAQVLINHTGLEATGEALLVSLTGPEMSYTLTDVEGLEYGSYYWRVRAIDGAQNGAEESYWTAPYSFKSGLLPLWAVIAIAVLVAVLIGGLVFVLVRRGTPYD